MPPGPFSLYEDFADSFDLKKLWEYPKIMYISAAVIMSLILGEIFVKQEKLKSEKVNTVAY